MTTSPRLARSLSLHLDADGFLSSPDPLATSVNDENIFLRSSPLKGASPLPRKRRTTKVLEDITRSSPQKVRTSSTLSSKSPSRSQNGHLLSPWKIRVTVEAEPDGEGLGKVRSTSKTTVVPLYDATPLPKESGVQGRSRGGSRKPGSKKITTPAPKRQTPQRSGAGVSQLSNLDTAFLDIEDMEAQNKVKKNLRGRTSRKACEILEHEVPANANTPLQQQKSNSSEVSETSRSSWNTGTGAELEAVVPKTAGSARLGELNVNRMTVQSYNMSPKIAKIQRMEESCRDNEKPTPVAIPTASASNAISNGKGQISAANAVTYPTPDASIQDETEALGPRSDPTEEHEGFDTILESEGFTMIDLESLPSARNFVTSTDIPEPSLQQPLTEMGMDADPVRPKSVSSPVLAPPSSLSVFSSPTRLSNTSKPPPTPIPSYLAPPDEGESDLSSTVPSSPPVQSIQQTFPARSVGLAASPLHQNHTPPALRQFSPKLPQPPDQSQKDEAFATGEDVKPTPPRLAGVVRAGIALQRLISPKSKKPSPSASPVPKIGNVAKHRPPTPKERLDGLFGGFDSGTRRELRAGLRFGEELAKRQRQPSPNVSSFGQRASPVPKLQSQQESDLVWRGSQHTPNRCSDSQDTRSTSKASDNGASQGSPGARMLESSLDANMSCGSIMFLNAEARERRWQSERAAISQQIEDANASQVIVIDSDSEDETHTTNAKTLAVQPKPTRSMTREADEDIWLAQAEEAERSSQLIQDDLFPRAEQIRQRERTREVYSRPKRSLLPSPWKRGEDVDSTSMTAGDASGMFWHQPKDKESAWLLEHPSSTIDVGEAPTRKPGIDRTHDERSATGRSGPVTTGETLSRAPQDFEHRQVTPSVSDDGGEASPERESRMADEEDLEFPPEVGAPSGKEEETCEGRSSAPLPIKIPVNFNETDLTSSIRSEDPFLDNGQRECPSPSPFCPQTPRSAFKGSRATLGLVSVSTSPTPRKVAFSGHSLCLDESGTETSMQVRGGTMSPEPPTARHDLRDDDTVAEDAQVVHDGARKERSVGVAAVPTSVHKQAPLVSWLSRLTGWGVTSAGPASDAPTAPDPPRRQQHSGMGKPRSHGKVFQWEPTRTTTASTRPCVTPDPSEASSQGTDPRIPPSPERLTASGSFSDNHYKHLHILYLKSLKSTFTQPGSVRPSLLNKVGRKCYSGDGEFAWEITRRDAEVVERWMRSFEGRNARDAVTDWSDKEGRYREVGWDELDLCMRLFSIVAGQATRTEQHERKEKQGLKKG